LCKPFKHGADIIVHSTSKYMDGHALQVGGVIVDGGVFDWQASGKFPGFTQPDASYHGIVYACDFGSSAYIAKARMQLMRDLGVYPSAHSAFLLNIGLETLPLRMERHCENALAVAQFFQASGFAESVRYPMLPNDPYFEAAMKYCPKGGSGVVAVSLKGSRVNAAKFLNRLKLASQEVHVADIRTCVMHPASSTHRQLTDEQLAATGVHPGLVRLSVGLEHIDDIIADIEGALP
jgi:O-acetylhomoserine (thiol)-lyase